MGLPELVVEEVLDRALAGQLVGDESPAGREFPPVGLADESPVGEFVQRLVDARPTRVQVVAEGCGRTRVALDGSQYRRAQLRAGNVGDQGITVHNPRLRGGRP
ncbi:hypothetical protein ACFQL4_07730 [Halosimplex aquaticum]